MSPNNEIKEYRFPYSAKLTPEQATEIGQILGQSLVEIVPLPPKKPRPPKRTWQDVPAWLRRYFSGSDMQIPFLLYEGKRFALVRIPGEMFWNWIGRQSYGEVEWQIITKDTTN